MRAVILIRILVGWVFISEGIQKFLFPAVGFGAPRFMMDRNTHAPVRQMTCR